jgi:hypothetical protein
MFRVSDGVVTGNYKSYRCTQYPVPGLCNILLQNCPSVTGELVLRVFVRTSWRYWSYVRGNDYWGYFRTQWNIQSKGPEERSRCGDLSPHYPCKSVICKFNFTGLYVVTFYSSWAQVERVGTLVSLVNRVCDKAAWKRALACIFRSLSPNYRAISCHILRDSFFAIASQNVTWFRRYIELYWWPIQIGRSLVRSQVVTWKFSLT